MLKSLGNQRAMVGLSGIQYQTGVLLRGRSRSARLLWLGNTKFTLILADRKRGRKGHLVFDPRKPNGIA